MQAELTLVWFWSDDLNQVLALSASASGAYLGFDEIEFRA